MLVGYMRARLLPASLCRCVLCPYIPPERCCPYNTKYDLYLLLKYGVVKRTWGIEPKGVRKSQRSVSA